MKVIIAGGRDYFPGANEAIEVIRLLDEMNAKEVVSGCATGVDKWGEDLARLLHLPIKKFPAKWSEEGRKAGPMRNEKMAVYADALIALPGGVGTADMVRRAEKHGLRVYRFPVHTR